MAGRQLGSSQEAPHPPKPLRKSYRCFYLCCCPFINIVSQSTLCALQPLRLKQRYSSPNLTRSRVTGCCKPGAPSLVRALGKAFAKSVRMRVQQSAMRAHSTAQTRHTSANAPSLSFASPRALLKPRRVIVTASDTSTKATVVTEKEAPAGSISHDETETSGCPVLNALKPLRPARNGVPQTLYNYWRVSPDVELVRPRRPRL